MKEEFIESTGRLPASYRGTIIGEKTYDLIHIDFDREHPVPKLVEMVKFNPGELVRLTDENAAQFVTDYVSQHLEVCDNGCREIARKEFKGY